MSRWKRVALDAVGTALRGRSFQARRERVRTSRYLNVGSGTAVPREFVNLDYQYSPRLDLCWDITAGIPIPDHSLQGVFTEHTLEHIPYEKVLGVLRDFARTLVPGGTVRIAVPDAELYVNAYQRGRAGEAVAFPTGAPANSLSADGQTPMMAVSRVFNGHGHLSAYDYETLAHLLTAAGFVDVRREQFRSGRDPVLLIDKERRRAESLYVEASTPA